jgi:hypothetical protein
MIDYYSVLARAIANLDSADPAARKELYGRARRLVVAEFRKQNPQISAQAIGREQAALEAAVRRVEAEIAQTTAKEKTRRQDSPNQDSPNSESAQVDLRDMPKALAAMLFGTAYLAAIIAFSGVIYLHGLALVYAGFVPYPLLLVAMAALGGLLVLLSRTVFRKLRMYSRCVVPPQP